MFIIDRVEYKSVLTVLKSSYINVSSVILSMILH